MVGVLPGQPEVLPGDRERHSRVPSLRQVRSLFVGDLEKKDASHVQKDPVMDLRLFRNYTFTIANVLAWISSAVFFGSIFLLSVFFERVENAAKEIGRAHV